MDVKLKHNLSVHFEPSLSADFPMVNYVLNFSMPGTTVEPSETFTRWKHLETMANFYPTKLTKTFETEVS